jgi:YteA family regulatory protein
MSHLTPEDLAAFKQILLEEKESLEQRLASNNHFDLSNSLRESVGELSAYDNHPGDTATELYEREKDIALNENAEHHLEDVNDALERIRSHEYGSCVLCDKPISYERLLAVPTTEYCIDHVPNRIVSERRPVEEQILTPPFGRTSLDEREEQSLFDGEDAWQIVESWGTSNTPAMAEGNHIDSYDSMYIEADEAEGYVEPLESFLATDIYGSHVTVVRNKVYKSYMENGEGDPLLEPDGPSAKP